MTPKTRSLREFRNPIGCLILLAALGAAAGCSTAETTGGSTTNVNHILPSGASVSGWLATPSGGTHASTATLDYIAGNGSSGCSECHGSDLSGGISKVSCFGTPAGCHHGPVPNWTSPAVHGATAKKAPGSSGFASCQICHGADFRTPRGVFNRTCYSCHTRAPHPNEPWNSSTTTHDNTDTANAPVCARCHYPGSPSNPAGYPATPAAAGTAPGCFNNTLCHGEGPPHMLGATWVNPTSTQFHGMTAKQNLSYCQGCHGTPGTPLFNGGSAPTSCQASCHTQAKAHPIRWYQAPGAFPNYVSSHRNSGNRSVACAICHKVDGAGTGPDPNSPSCFAASFNGVSCHTNGPGEPNHPVPNLDTTHTLAADNDFSANCGNCHSKTGTSPVSSAPACDSCHTNFAARSPLAFKDCTSCHASPPNGGAPAGSVYPNIAGTHSVHLGLNTPSNPNGTPVSCSTCHNGLTSRTLEHYNRAKSRVPPGDVAFLATYNAQSGASSFLSSAFTCGNVSCHGGTSPNWRTGTIDPLADCTICHKSATTSPPQYNDYRETPFPHTGKSQHRVACNTCHDTALLTSLRHFGELSNTTFPPGAAAQTIRSTLSYNPATPLTQGSCSFPNGVCHND